MDSFSFLRKVPMFADLPDSDLEQLCAQVEEVRLAKGEILFVEGSRGQQAYVIKEGKIEIYKNADGVELQLAVRAPGEVIGEIALLEDTPRNATGRALVDSLVLSISGEQLDHLLHASPTAARTMIHTIATRLRSTELALGQKEKMAQLGTLTAGIAHELNNPASATGRGADQMKSTLHQLQLASISLYTMGLTPTQMGKISTLEEQIHHRALEVVDLDPIERGDREAEIEDWLDRYGIASGWELAPQLVSLEYDRQRLDTLAQDFPENALPVLLEWIAAGYSTYCLLDEIGQGSGRISEIVKALKNYAYLDQGPVQEVNVQEGLENTLVILRHKLKQGIEVRREYDARLPGIQAHGSELNQVWTNLIENAIDAVEMAGTNPAERKGRLILRTRFNDPWVVVDIEDNGPGISPEVQDQLFNPFFTTKPMGKGTGLGLYISYNIIQRHGGEIKVRSNPGETHFKVWLPVNRAAGDRELDRSEGE